MKKLTRKQSIEVLQKLDAFLQRIGTLADGPKNPYFGKSTSNLSKNQRQLAAFRGAN